MNGSTTWGLWRACAKRLVLRRGWMLKTQAIENRVSVGTATVAMILNGLGKSLRQLYLVPQSFANKPVEQRHGCGDQGRDARVTTVWVAPWIGCTRTTRRKCLRGSPAERGRSLASRPIRYMWTQPLSRSVERTAAQASARKSRARPQR